MSALYFSSLMSLAILILREFLHMFAGVLMIMQYSKLFCSDISIIKSEESYSIAQFIKLQTNNNAEPEDDLNSSFGQSAISPEHTLPLSPSSSPMSNEDCKNALQNLPCSCLNCRYMLSHRTRTVTPSSMKSPDQSVLDVMEGFSKVNTPDLSQDTKSDKPDSVKTQPKTSSASGPVWAWDLRYMTDNRPVSPWLPSGMLPENFLRGHLCCRCNKSKHIINFKGGRGRKRLPCCSSIPRKRPWKYVVLGRNQTTDKTLWPFEPGEVLTVDSSDDLHFCHYPLKRAIHSDIEISRSKSVDYYRRASGSRGSRIPSKRRKKRRSSLTPVSADKDSYTSGDADPTLSGTGTKSIQTSSGGPTRTRSPESTIASREKYVCDPTVVLPVSGPPPEPYQEDMNKILRRQCHQRVIAFCDHDGVFYPGTVYAFMSPDSSIIRFRHNGALAEIPTVLTLPIIDMSHSQTLVDADTVLVRVKNTKMQCECWVPGRVQGGFLGSPDPRLPLRHRYQVQLFSGANHVFRRRDILKINPNFHASLVRYIRLKKVGADDQSPAPEGESVPAQTPVKKKPRKRRKSKTPSTRVVIKTRPFKKKDTTVEEPPPSPPPPPPPTTRKEPPTPREKREPRDFRTIKEKKEPEETPVIPKSIPDRAPIRPPPAPRPPPEPANKPQPQPQPQSQPQPPLQSPRRPMEARPIAKPPPVEIREPPKEKPKPKPHKSNKPKHAPPKKAKQQADAQLTHEYDDYAGTPKWNLSAIESANLEEELQDSPSAHELEHTLPDQQQLLDTEAEQEKNAEATSETIVSNELAEVVAARDSTIQSLEELEIKKPIIEDVRDQEQKTADSVQGPLVDLAESGNVADDLSLKKQIHDETKQTLEESPSAKPLPSVESDVAKEMAVSPETSVADINEKQEATDGPTGTKVSENEGLRKLVHDEKIEDVSKLDDLSAKPINLPGYAEPQWKTEAERDLGETQETVKPYVGEGHQVKVTDDDRLQKQTHDEINNITSMPSVLSLGHISSETASVASENEQTKTDLSVLPEKLSAQEIKRAENARAIQGFQRQVHDEEIKSIPVEKTKSIRSIPSDTAVKGHADVLSPSDKVARSTTPSTMVAENTRAEDNPKVVLNDTDELHPGTLKSEPQSDTTKYPHAKQDAVGKSTTKQPDKVDSKIRPDGKIQEDSRNQKGRIVEERDAKETAAHADPKQQNIGEMATEPNKTKTAEQPKETGVKSPEQITTDRTPGDQIERMDSEKQQPVDKAGVATEPDKSKLAEQARVTGAKSPEQITTDRTPGDQIERMDSEKQQPVDKAGVATEPDKSKLAEQARETGAKLPEQNTTDRTPGDQIVRLEDNTQQPLDKFGSITEKFGTEAILDDFAGDESKMIVSIPRDSSELVDLEVEQDMSKLIDGVRQPEIRQPDQVVGVDSKIPEVLIESSPSFETDHDNELNIEKHLRGSNVGLEKLPIESQIELLRSGTESTMPDEEIEVENVVTAHKIEGPDIHVTEEKRYPLGGPEGTDLSAIEPGYQDAEKDIMDRGKLADLSETIKGMETVTPDSSRYLHGPDLALSDQSKFVPGTVHPEESRFPLPISTRLKLSLVPSLNSEYKLAINCNPGEIHGSESYIRVRTKPEIWLPDHKSFKLEVFHSTGLTDTQYLDYRTTSICLSFNVIQPSGQAEVKMNESRVRSPTEPLKSSTIVSTNGQSSPDQECTTKSLDKLNESEQPLNRIIDPNVQEHGVVPDTMADNFGDPYHQSFNQDSMTLRDEGSKPTETIVTISSRSSIELPIRHSSGRTSPKIIATSDYVLSTPQVDEAALANQIPSPNGNVPDITITTSASFSTKRTSELGKSTKTPSTVQVILPNTPQTNTLDIPEEKYLTTSKPDSHDNVIKAQVNPDRSPNQILPAMRRKIEKDDLTIPRSVNRISRDQIPNEYIERTQPGSLEYSTLDGITIKRPVEPEPYFTSVRSVTPNTDEEGLSISQSISRKVNSKPKSNSQEVKLPVKNEATHPVSQSGPRVVFETDDHLVDSTSNVEGLGELSHSIDELIMDTINSLVKPIKKLENTESNISDLFTPTSHSEKQWEYTEHLIPGELSNSTNLNAQVELNQPVALSEGPIDQYQPVSYETKSNKLAGSVLTSTDPNFRDVRNSKKSLSILDRKTPSNVLTEQVGEFSQESLNSPTHASNIDHPEYQSPKVLSYTDQTSQLVLQPESQITESKSQTSEKSISMDKSSDQYNEAYRNEFTSGGTSQPLQPDDSASMKIQNVKSINLAMSISCTDETEVELQARLDLSIHNRSTDESGRPHSQGFTEFSARNIIYLDRAGTPNSQTHRVEMDSKNEYGPSNSPSLSISSTTRVHVSSSPAPFEAHFSLDKISFRPSSQNAQSPVSKSQSSGPKSQSPYLKSHTPESFPGSSDRVNISKPELEVQSENNDLPDRTNAESPTLSGLKDDSRPQSANIFDEEADDQDEYDEQVNGTKVETNEPQNQSCSDFFVSNSLIHTDTVRFPSVLERISNRMLRTNCKVSYKTSGEYIPEIIQVNDNDCFYSDEEHDLSSDNDSQTSSECLLLLNSNLSKPFGDQNQSFELNDLIRSDSKYSYPNENDTGQSLILRVYIAEIHSTNSTNDQLVIIKDTCRLGQAYECMFHCSSSNSWSTSESSRITTSHCCLNSSRQISTEVGIHDSLCNLINYDQYVMKTSDYDSKLPIISIQTDTNENNCQKIMGDTEKEHEIIFTNCATLNKLLISPITYGYNSTIYTSMNISVNENMQQRQISYNLKVKQILNVMQHNETKFIGSIETEYRNVSDISSKSDPPIRNGIRTNSLENLPICLTNKAVKLGSSTIEFENDTNITCLGNLFEINVSPICCSEIISSKDKIQSHRAHMQMDTVIFKQSLLQTEQLMPDFRIVKSPCTTKHDNLTRQNLQFVNSHREHNKIEATKFNPQLNADARISVNNTHHKGSLGLPEDLFKGGDSIENVTFCGYIQSRDSQKPGKLEASKGVVPEAITVRDMEVQTNGVFCGDINAKLKFAFDSISCSGESDSVLSDDSSNSFGLARVPSSCLLSSSTIYNLQHLNPSSSSECPEDDGESLPNSKSEIRKSFCDCITHPILNRPKSCESHDWSISGTSKIPSYDEIVELSSRHSSTSELGTNSDLFYNVAIAHSLPCDRSSVSVTKQTSNELFEGPHLFQNVMNSCLQKSTAETEYPDKRSSRKNSYVTNFEVDMFSIFSDSYVCEAISKSQTLDLTSYTDNTSSLSFEDHMSKPLEQLFLNYFSKIMSDPDGCNHVCELKYVPEVFSPTIFTENHVLDLPLVFESDRSAQCNQFEYAEPNPANIGSEIPGTNTELSILVCPKLYSKPVVCNHANSMFCLNPLYNLLANETVLLSSDTPFLQTDSLPILIAVNQPNMKILDHSKNSIHGLPVVYMSICPFFLAIEVVMIELSSLTHIEINPGCKRFNIYASITLNWKFDCSSLFTTSFLSVVETSKLASPVLFCYALNSEACTFKCTQEVDHLWLLFDGRTKECTPLKIDLANMHSNAESVKYIDALCEGRSPNKIGYVYDYDNKDGFRACPSDHVGRSSVLDLGSRLRINIPSQLPKISTTLKKSIERNWAPTRLKQFSTNDVKQSTISTPVHFGNHKPTEGFRMVKIPVGSVLRNYSFKELNSLSPEFTRPESGSNQTPVAILPSNCTVQASKSLWGKMTNDGSFKSGAVKSLNSRDKLGLFSNDFTHLKTSRGMASKTKQSGCSSPSIKSFNSLPTKPQSVFDKRHITSVNTANRTCKSVSNRYSVPTSSVSHKSEEPSKLSKAYDPKFKTELCPTQHRIESSHSCLPVNMTYPDRHRSNQKLEFRSMIKNRTICEDKYIRNGDYQNVTTSKMTIGDCKEIRLSYPTENLSKVSWTSSDHKNSMKTDVKLVGSFMCAADQSKNSRYNKGLSTQLTKDKTDRRTLTTQLCQAYHTNRNINKLNRKHESSLS